MRRIVTIGSPADSASPAHPAIAVLAALALSGCGGKPADSDSAALPPVDSDSATALDSFQIDTFRPDSDANEPPPATLSITHGGAWALSPNGGPWDSVTGDLSVLEVLDGDTLAPTCELEFSLTGQAVTEDTCPGCACPTCAVTLDVLHYLVSGDPATCLDAELPEDGERRRMGWDEAAQQIMLDWEGSGVWLAWYPGERVDDAITFLYEAEVATEAPEEDP